MRVALIVGSGLLHLGLSYWFNYRWANTQPNGVDGGPLGFLTWTIPATVGTLACDAVASAAGWRPSARELTSDAMRATLA